MTKLTQHFVRLTAVLSSFGLIACPAEDDNGTGADTGTLSTSVSTSMTTEPAESSGDPATASAESGGTTDPTDATTDPTMPQDTGGDCLPTDECQDDSMCAGGMCIGCICIGGAETTGGGECPGAETCEMTGGGGMACLGEASHCVLACGGGMACPDSMECQGGACQYDAMNLPAMGDPNYPAPVGNMCPDGFLAVSFVMNYVVCIPVCDGMGPMAACPQGGSGSAAGACLTNPTSSGMPCG